MRGVVIGGISRRPSATITGRSDGTSQVNFPFLGRVVVVVVGVVVVLTTTACTSDARRSEPVPSSFAFSGIAPPTPDPLLEYSQNSTVMGALARAETILTQKWMRRFGYDYKPVMNFEKYAERFVIEDGRFYVLLTRLSLRFMVIYPLLVMWGFLTRMLRLRVRILILS